MKQNTIDQHLTLYGECGEFALSDRAWRLALTLASVHGWQPHGTLPPDPEYVEDDVTRVVIPWDGRYVPAACQRMTDADARALADALERALPDVPNHDALTAKVWTSGGGESLRLWGRPARPDVMVTAIEEFSGANKQYLVGLIAHLREGGEVWIC